MSAPSYATGLPTPCWRPDQKGAGKANKESINFTVLEQLQKFTTGGNVVVQSIIQMNLHVTAIECRVNETNDGN